MNEQQIKSLIQSEVQGQLQQQQQTQLPSSFTQNSNSSQFTVASVAKHTHDGINSVQLTPAVALTGFPVRRVQDASSRPSSNASNGQFIFQVDQKPVMGVPTFHCYLWAYVFNPLLNTPVWAGIQIQ